jgi:hypothetical protein
MVTHLKGDGLLNVGYWHLADLDAGGEHVRF